MKVVEFRVKCAVGSSEDTAKLRERIQSDLTYIFGEAYALGHVGVHDLYEGQTPGMMADPKTQAPRDLRAQELWGRLWDEWNVEAAKIVKREQRETDNPLERMAFCLSEFLRTEDVEEPEEQYGTEFAEKYMGPWMRAVEDVRALFREVSEISGVKPGADE
jgi:hypothetical protein